MQSILCSLRLILIIVILVVTELEEPLEDPQVTMDCDVQLLTWRRAFQKLLEIMHVVVDQVSLTPEILLLLPCFIVDCDYNHIRCVVLWWLEAGTPILSVINPVHLILLRPTTNVLNLRCIQRRSTIQLIIIGIQVDTGVQAGVQAWLVGLRPLFPV